MIIFLIQKNNMYLYIRIIRQIFIKLHVCSWPHQLAPISILSAAWFIGKGEKYEWNISDWWAIHMNYDYDQSVPFPRCLQCLLGLAHNNLHCLLQRSGIESLFLKQFHRCFIRISSFYDVRIFSSSENVRNSI